MCLRNCVVVAFCLNTLIYENAARWYINGQVLEDWRIHTIFICYDRIALPWTEFISTSAHCSNEQRVGCVQFVSKPATFDTSVLVPGYNVYNMYAVCTGIEYETMRKI